MKTITKISAALFGCMLAVSCDTGLSNEELGVVDNSGNGRLNPANVYIRQEQVQRIHGQNILDYTFNNEGFLTGVIYDGQLTYSFDYPESDPSKVILTEYTMGDDNEYYTEFTIGANGFANMAINTCNYENYREVYKFYYDSEGHLVKCNLAGDVYTFKYENGNLVELKSDEHTETITYNEKANDYAVMPYTSVSPSYINSSFGVSLTHAFLAGILGRPTKNLPATTRIHYNDNSVDDVNYTFVYRYDGSGNLIGINYEER